MGGRLSAAGQRRVVYSKRDRGHFERHLELHRKVGNVVPLEVAAEGLRI